MPTPSTASARSRSRSPASRCCRCATKACSISTIRSRAGSPRRASSSIRTRDERPITLRQLTQHTSGLPRMGPFEPDHGARRGDGRGLAREDHARARTGARVPCTRTSGSRCSASSSSHAAKQPLHDVIAAAHLHAARDDLDGMGRCDDVPAGRLAPAFGTGPTRAPYRRRASAPPTVPAASTRACATWRATRRSCSRRTRRATTTTAARSGARRSAKRSSPASRWSHTSGERCEVGEPHRARRVVVRLRMGPPPDLHSDRYRRAQRRDRQLSRGARAPHVERDRRRGARATSATPTPKPSPTARSRSWKRPAR